MQWYRPRDSGSRYEVGRWSDILIKLDPDRITKMTGQIGIRARILRSTPVELPVDGYTIVSGTELKTANLINRPDLLLRGTKETFDLDAEERDFVEKVGTILSAGRSLTSLRTTTTNVPPKLGPSAPPGVLGWGRRRSWAEYRRLDATLPDDIRLQNLSVELSAIVQRSVDASRAAEQALRTFRDHLLERFASAEVASPLRSDDYEELLKKIDPLMRSVEAVAQSTRNARNAWELVSQLHGSCSAVRSGQKTPVLLEQRFACLADVIERASAAADMSATVAVSGLPTDKSICPIQLLLCPDGKCSPFDVKPPYSGANCEEQSIPTLRRGLWSFYSDKYTRALRTRIVNGRVKLGAAADLKHDEIVEITITNEAPRLHVVDGLKLGRDTKEPSSYIYRARFRVVDEGLSVQFGQQIAFAKRLSDVPQAQGGDNPANFSPAAGARVMLRYRCRPAWTDWALPSLGAVALLLKFSSQQPAEVGLGFNLGLLNDMIHVGMGWNLNVTDHREFFFVGIDFIQTADTFKGVLGKAGP